MEAYKESEDVTVIYECGECGEQHETKALAKSCCARWFCGWCGEEFETKTAANKCCKETTV